MSDLNSLTHEERMKMAVQAEMLMEIFAKKNGLSVHQVVESIRWVERHRDWMESLKRSGSFAIIGFLASALLLAIWEGAKILILRSK